jgi:uncharacterized delta-60 repeat protein
MYRLLAFLPALLGFVIAATPAAAAQRCDLPGATTVVADAQARVFSVPGKGATVRRYFGCRNGHKPFLLAADRSPKSSQDLHTEVTLMRLTGTWVAWHSSSSSDFGTGEFAESIEARSLSGAHRSLSIPVTGEPLTALQVLADGTIGWVLSIGEYREIDAIAHATTTPTPLAYTRGIDSKSVIFASDHVSWVQNGDARSAPLVAPAPPPSGNALGPQALDGRVGDCGTFVPAAAPTVLPEASELVAAPDGKVVAAGTASSGQGDPLQTDTFVIARLTPDGAFDPGFGTGGVVQTLVPGSGASQSSALTGAAVQPDGRVVVAGIVRRNETAVSSVVVYRLNADGTPDASFGDNGLVQHAVRADTSADVRSVALTASGAILLAGQRDNHFYVARLLGDGSLDPAFGSGGLAIDPGKDVSLANALAVEPDGTILAGGQAASEPMLIRFSPEGVAQSGVYRGPAAASAITALAALPDGGVIAAGTASNVVAKDQLFLARYTPAGVPVTGFAAGGFLLDPQVSGPRDVAVDPAGRLLVSGSFYLLPGPYFGSGLVRYLADGSRDTSFGLRGALGGVSSYGLTNNQLLLEPGTGTALVAQGNGDRFAVSRLALDSPATGATAAAPSVCAMATSPRLGPLRNARKLGVSLRLRAPGRLRLTATVTVAGRTLPVGHVTVFRPFIEGAVATISVSAATARRLRGVRRARLTVLGGAPGGAQRRYTTTLTG